MAAFYYSWWSALWWLHIPFYSILFLRSNFICTSLFACIHLQNYVDKFSDFTHLRKCEKYSSLENFNAHIYAHLVNWISENFPWIFNFVLWYISSKFWWSQRPQMERFLGLDYSQSLDIVSLGTSFFDVILTFAGFRPIYWWIRTLQIYLWPYFWI